MILAILLILFITFWILNFIYHGLFLFLFLLWLASRLEFDPMWEHEIVVIPWPLVRFQAATFDMRALTVASEELRQLVSVDVLQEDRLPVTADNSDFVSCSLVDETLANLPYTRKQKRCIYHEQCSHSFRIVIRS